MKKQIILILSLVGTALQAKLYTPDLERSFLNQIKRHSLVVVHFNPFPENEEYEPGLNEMKRAFINLSRDSRYKNADVAFIGINLQKLPELAHEYNIAVPDWSAIKKEAKTEGEEKALKQITGDQESTILLFKDGEPFKDKGQIAQKTGFMTETQLEDFIESHFSNFINEIIAKNKEAQRQREQMRQAHPKTVYRYPVGSQPGTRTYRVRYARPYYDYDYYDSGPYFGYTPWWGGPWSWGGPGFGFSGPGFSFGFGW
jgi:hypothetical protein